MNVSGKRGEVGEEEEERRHVDKQAKKEERRKVKFIGGDVIRKDNKRDIMIKGCDILA